MTYLVRPDVNNQALLRDAVAMAKKYKNDDVMLEPGEYVFTTPLILCAAPFETLILGGRQRNTVQLKFPSILDRPLVTHNSSRDSYLHDFTIVGANIKPGYVEQTNAPADYRSPGILFDRYGGHIGFAIDQGATAGSSHDTYERVVVQNCGVGWTIGASATSLNADRLKWLDCGAFKCEVGMSHGHSQARANVVENFSISMCRVGFTGMQHGLRQGVPPRIDGLQADWTHHLFEYYSTFGTVLDVAHVHAEAIAGIGNWGAGAPEDKTPGTIRYSTFNIGMAGWTRQQVGMNNSLPCLFEAHAGVEFDTCEITNNYALGQYPFVSGRPGQIKLNNMAISPTVVLG